MSAREADRHAAASPLPTQIGRYKIIERIGKGAMGVVYRARDEQLDRHVAVKVLMTDFAEEPDVRARFYREAQSAGRLLHRNIITIFDLGDDRGRAYIVMELLAGATLSDYMTRPQAADIESKVDLMMQVCDGLSAAHAAGIIHRDIKPGNLFVLNDGGLKVLDFGVARLVTSSMTVRGHIIGTPSYMSPEQATGRQIDHRSDIFSAGGVFYWMLSGRKPFAAPDLPSVLRKVQLEDPPALRDQDAPAPLARIVFRALAKDPAMRYQRISDMLGDLQRFQRQFEADALRLGGLAQGHAQAIDSLREEMTGLRLRLGTGAAEAPDPFAGLLERYPVLAERGLGSLGNLTFRHAVTENIARDLERLRSSEEADAAALRSEVQAAEAEAERRAGEADRLAREGERVLQQASAAIEAGRFDDAQAALEEARRIHRSPEAVESAAGRLAERRASAAAEQALAKQADEAVAAAHNLFAERRRPEAIELLEDFLAEHPTATAVQQEITRLRREASSVADQERRQAEIDALVVSAQSALTGGRLEEAGRLARSALAREVGQPAAAAVLHEVEAAERAGMEALARTAMDTVAAAREVFKSGRREEAIAKLAAFGTENPAAAGIGQEVERLREEASHLAEQERRQTEIERCCARAAGAMAAGEFEAARVAAARVVELEPTHDVGLRLLAESRARQRAAADAAARRARVANLLERARLGLRDGALRQTIGACRSVEVLEPGNPDAAVLKAEAEQRVDRLRLALHQAREARRLERAAGRRLFVARIAMRLGKYKRAYDAASEVLAAAPGSPHAAAIRDAAAAAIGFDQTLADDDTVGEPNDLCRGESSVADDETVGTGTTISGRAPD